MRRIQMLWNSAVNVAEGTINTIIDERRHKSAPAFESKSSAGGFFVSQVRLSKRDDAPRFGRQVRRRRNQAW